MEHMVILEDKFLKKIEEIKENIVNEKEEDYIG